MATYQASWGNKGFIISPSKIVPLLDLTTGFARKSDTNNDTSGQPTTNTRGLDLQTMQLDTRYVAAAGVDPRGQIDEWKAQFGKRYPLLINGKQFGPDLMELDSVDVSNIQMDNRGRFLSVDISITLVEYVPPTTTVSSKKAASSSTSSSSTSSSRAKSSGTKAGALAATASSTDKQTKKLTVMERKLSKM